MYYIITYSCLRAESLLGKQLAPGARRSTRTEHRSPFKELLSHERLRVLVTWRKPFAFAWRYCPSQVLLAFSDQEMSVVEMEFASLTAFSTTTPFSTNVSVTSVGVAREVAIRTFASSS